MPVSLPMLMSCPSVKRGLLALLMFLPLVAGAPPPFALTGPKFLAVPVAASGPNAWYDVETQANTDTDASGTVDALEWAVVTVAQGGSATKARIYLRDNSGGSTIKMGIYAAGGGSVLASGTATIADGTCCDNAYLEVTFGTPVTVTATTYLIAWIGTTGVDQLNFRYKASSGNWKSKLSYGYSSFPGTLPSPDFNLSRGYAVSLFVQ